MVCDVSPRTGLQAALCVADHTHTTAILDTYLIVACVIQGLVGPTSTVQPKRVLQELQTSRRACRGVAMLGLLAWSQIDFPSAGKVPRLARNAKRARFVSLESSFFVDVGVIVGPCSIAWCDCTR